MGVASTQMLGSGEQAKIGSLFGRFLFFLVPIFVVASMLGLAFVSNVLLRAERDSINDRIGVFTTRIATIIKTETGPDNGRLNTNLVNLLLVDPAIRCVEMIDSGGRVLADAPDK